MSRTMTQVEDLFRVVFDMLFSELYKFLVNEVTLLGFTRNNALFLAPPLIGNE